MNQRELKIFSFTGNSLRSHRVCIYSHREFRPSTAGLLPGPRTLGPKTGYARCHAESCEMAKSAKYIPFAIIA